jgi:hypothetical protein
MNKEIRYKISNSKDVAPEKCRYIQQEAEKLKNQADPLVISEPQISKKGTSAGKAGIHSEKPKNGA